LNWISKLTRIQEYVALGCMSTDILFRAAKWTNLRSIVPLAIRLKDKDLWFRLRISW